MKKSDHDRFLALLDTALIEIGAVKAVDATMSKRAGCEHLPDSITYTVGTIFGELVLHPSIPYSLTPGDRKRLHYDVTVFARFSGSGPFPARANQHSGKWNFHLGERVGTDIEIAVEHVASDVNRILASPVEA